MLIIRLLSLITIGIGSIHSASARPTVTAYLGSHADYLENNADLSYSNLIYTQAETQIGQWPLLFGKYLPECCMLLSTT